MKNLLLSLFFSVIAMQGSAQFLNLGIGAGASKTKLSLNSNSAYGKWYFPNLENEIIVLKGIKPDIKMKPAGSVYAIYTAKQNYLLRTDIQFSYNESDILYANSVDTVTYFSALKGIAGHQSMTFRYWFLGSTIDVGYIFLPTKPFRPYILAGVGVLSCLNITQVGDYVDHFRSERNAFIRREIVTFKRFSPKANFSVGLRYHSISAEANISTNLGSIDRYSESEDEKTYARYIMYGFTVKLDLFTFNLSPSTGKKKVKELSKFN